MQLSRTVYPHAESPLSVVQSPPDTSRLAAVEVDFVPPAAGEGLVGDVEPLGPSPLEHHPRRRRTRADDGVVPVAAPEEPRAAVHRPRRAASRGSNAVLSPELVERAGRAGVSPEEYVARLLRLDDPVVPEGSEEQVSAPELVAGFPVTRAMVVSRRGRSLPRRPLLASSSVSPSVLVSLVLAGLLAVIVAVVGFVAASEYMPRYEVLTVERGDGETGVYRVDRWTGDLAYCGVRTAGLPAPATACVVMPLGVEASMAGP